MKKRSKNELIYWISGLILQLVSIKTYSVELTSLHFVSLHYPPLIYSNNQKHIDGLAVKKVREMANFLGYKVKFSITSWNRALKSVRKGKYDGIFTIFKTNQREEYLYFTENMFIPQNIYIYTFLGSDYSFNQLQLINWLKKKSIGVVSTLSYGKNFDGIRNNLKLFPLKSLESGFKLLINHRIDAIPSNMHTGNLTLAKFPKLYNKIQPITSAPLESVPSFIAFSKSKPRLERVRNQFDQELMKLKNSNWYEEALKEEVEEYLKSSSE